LPDTDTPLRAPLLGVPEPRGASWRYHVRTSERFEFSWGFHHEIELVLITEGSGRRLVGDSIEPYRPNDLVLIGAQLPHTYVSAAGVDRNVAVIVQFATDFLGGALWDSPEFAAIADLLHRSRLGIAFDDPPNELVLELGGLGHLAPARRTAALLGTLQSLTEHLAQRRLASLGYSPQVDGTRPHRIDAVCGFLHTAYARKVTLEEVAELVHMSPPACSRFFRRTMGRTLTDYLNELRLSAACRLLVETELPIIDVAAASGFRNLSYFNRRFLRRTGMAPRRYRAHYREPR
jgi:AraC-like DNA-binding protein